MFLLLPASCLLTWIAGHLVPLPLSPQAPCLQSPLFSHLCPLSLVLSLQPPAPLELTFTIHLACPALPCPPLHKAAGAPALLPSVSLVPHCLLFLLPSLPGRVLLRFLSWFSPSTPSHQLVLSLGHFFPAPLPQCTGALVTHPSVCCKVSSLGALLGPSVWSLPHPCSLRSLGLSAAAGHVSAQFGPVPSAPSRVAALAPDQPNFVYTATFLCLGNAKFFFFEI